MSSAQILVQNPAAVLREEFDGWGVLYLQNSTAAVGINPTGILIWKAVDGASTRAEIIRRVLEEYDEVSETAAEEVGVYIDQLVEARFLREEGEEREL